MFLSRRINRYQLCMLRVTECLSSKTNEERKFTPLFLHKSEIISEYIFSVCFVNLVQHVQLASDVLISSPRDDISLSNDEYARRAKK